MKENERKLREISLAKMCLDKSKKILSKGEKKLSPVDKRPSKDRDCKPCKGMANQRERAKGYKLAIKPG